MRTGAVRFFLLLIAMMLAGRVANGQPENATVSRPVQGSPLLLVSMDGFRWDYCDLHPEETPNLRRLRSAGVSAKGLIPVFPSNTFPNHYSLVTGLYPVEHGMINNQFFDEEHQLFFRYNQPGAASESRWWGGEPIWVTAINQGRKAAVSFWVGSEAEIKGVRPTFYRKFDSKLSFDVRLEEVISWLQKPDGQRPDFLAFYLEETNDTGHRFGPGSPEVIASIKLLDTRLGVLLTRIAQLGLTPNVVVVSDHGMESVDLKRVSTLEDFFEPSEVQIESHGSVVGLRPLQGDVASVLAKAKRIPHAKAYRVSELPAHFKLREHPRVSPIWVIPDVGAHVTTRAALAVYQTRHPIQGYLPGDHGYDPNHVTMHGIFIGHGPAFRTGVTVPAVENIHVYNLLCRVLGITPALNSGDDRLRNASLQTP